MSRARGAILIGGRGSNMAALLAAASAPGYPAEFPLVISHDVQAPGLARAREAGAETLAIERAGFPDRDAQEAAIDKALAAAGIGFLALAGWMRILGPRLLDRWAGRLLNIHPSLLPAFPGLHTHARALAAGVRLHGCTVHQVTAELDAGPILAQAAIPVLPGDTEAALAARVLAQENRLYPEAVRAFLGAPPAPPDPAAVVACVWVRPAADAP